MSEVPVLGVGMIPFGRRAEDTLLDMLAYASLHALDDAGLGEKGVDAVYVGNMGAGMLQHQSAIASSLVDRLSLLPAAAEGAAGPGSARRWFHHLLQSQFPSRRHRLSSQRGDGGAEPSQRRQKHRPWRRPATWQACPGCSHGRGLC